MTGRMIAGGVFVMMGCSNTGTPVGTHAGDPEPSDFCSGFVEAFEGYLETCGCGSAEREAFRARVGSTCEPGGSFGKLSEAVATGKLIYDAQAAAALFARLGKQSPACVEEQYVAFGLESGQIWSYAGAFKGTRAIGEACSMPVSYKGGISDCREGACAPDGVGGGVCIALAGEGEACDESGDNNLRSTTGRLCFDAHAAADSDGEYESAFDALNCATAPGSANRICVRGLADGKPCTSSSACKSGLCSQTDGADRVCIARRANGASCEDHAECASGACQTAEPRVCGPLLANGALCAYSDEACASGSCNDPDGTGGTCGPAPSRRPGESCTSSTDCITAGSGNSRDKVCHEGRCIADVCAAQLP